MTAFIYYYVEYCIFYNIPYCGLLTFNKIIPRKIYFYNTFFFLLRAVSVANGSSQARDQIRAAVAGLCHSHSNARSELHL